MLEESFSFSSFSDMLRVERLRTGGVEEPLPLPFRPLFTGARISDFSVGFGASEVGEALPTAGELLDSAISDSRMILT